MNEMKILPPKGKADVVLDTDTWNEADDQYALSYLLKNSDALSTKAVYAAPFLNKKVETPKEGMEKSYDEIMRILDLNGRADLKTEVYKGSERYLENEKTPVDSAAARDLVRRAAGYRREDPLYVVAIGCITNVASALLLDPSIAERTVVVWLGGHAHHWSDTGEFNMAQDIAAARVVMNSGVRFVQLPCKGVVSEFRTTRYELEHWIGNKNPLCDHLLKGTYRKVESYTTLDSAWSRVIWDVTAVAWLLNTDERFMFTRECEIRLPGYDRKYEERGNGKYMTYVYGINRDALMEDLFNKLTNK